MAWYIRVVLILCEVGQLQGGTVHFFPILSFFFTHIVISDRTKVGRCMDMDLPVISRPFLLFIKPPVFLPRTTTID